ncbi:hypothetical protein IS740_002279 [Escherichia coli]|nr:hypothetical protein [Escherichia coli]
MGRRRSHERRDLPPNLYIRNNGYYCYRDPRTGKEFGLGETGESQSLKLYRPTLSYFQDTNTSL